ncbi:Integrase [Roseobacter sp. AzwK-3b]|uniref:tyrosine-type recombinase/integrase n=1 Tax=Roseobacter sp. AzwK-3b TaxID=351016 RepID=UPI000156A1B7|nr:site-specific integrase [Roseobacter sp. AzwK-3b]EDM69392.1 Integrase [Roseobacter sp. AzwK-3b]
MAQAQTFSDTQLKRILHWCSTRRHPTRDRTIVLTSFYAGLRAKEIAALKVGDVYDDQGAVRDQFTLTAAQAKGGKSRTVWINRRLRRQLVEYRDAVLGSRSTAEPLFVSQKGGAFSANTMTQLFLVIYKSAGFANASSHSGRRSFITNLAAKSVSVRVLAELAGHSSIQTTQRYIDVNPKQMSEAVELL